LTGNYRHTIDAKGRLFIPAKLRDELGERFYVTRGLDECLSVYSEANWKVIEDKVSALPLAQARNLQRMLFSSAAACELDAQGRIVIPQILREYANLEKDVTVIGVSNRAEIWDSSKWEEINSTVSPESLAEEMDKLGF
jgi:MraZ protein